MENTTRPSSVVSCIHLFPLLALQLWQSWYHHNAVCHLSTRQKSVDACKSFTTSHHQSCNQIWAERFPPNRSTPTRTGHPTPRCERPKRRRRGVLPSSSVLTWTSRLYNNIAVLQLLLQTTAMNHLHCQIDIKHTETALGSSTNNWCCCFS